MERHGRSLKAVVLLVQRIWTSTSPAPHRAVSNSRTADRISRSPVESWRPSHVAGTVRRAFSIETVGTPCTPTGPREWEERVSNVSTLTLESCSTCRWARGSLPGQLLRRGPTGHRPVAWSLLPGRGEHRSPCCDCSRDRSARRTEKFSAYRGAMRKVPRKSRPGQLVLIRASQYHLAASTPRTLLQLQR